MFEGLGDIFPEGAGAIASKATDYGNKWLNNKLNLGVTYANNYLRQFDILGIMPEQWTILNNGGSKAIEFTSFYKANTKLESKVTQMPVENGSFVSYNIVDTPLEMEVTLIKQGLPQDLQDVVNTLLDYISNTELVSIVTPDCEYPNMKLTKANFERSAENGTDRLICECNFVEVRQFEVEYTSARVAQKQSRGQQQTKPTSALAGGLSMIKSVFQ